MQTFDFVSGLHNSPNPSRVYIRLCKHGKRFLLLKYQLYIKPSTKEQTGELTVGRALSGGPSICYLGNAIKA